MMPLSSRTHFHFPNWDYKPGPDLFFLSPHFPSFGIYHIQHPEHAKHTLPLSYTHSLLLSFSETGIFRTTENSKTLKSLAQKGSFLYAIRGVKLTACSLSKELKTTQPSITFKVYSNYPDMTLANWSYSFDTE